MSTWVDVGKMEKVRLFLEEKLKCPVSKAKGEKEKCYSYFFYADGGKSGMLEIPRMICRDNNFKDLLIKIDQKVLTRMKDKKENVVLK